ncbi:Transcription factor [Macleaya cordata]|uniref:Transcription factor n=1 Tax=Macleaya cordata TaxID=56857 RepID=A0A200Q554_MACCD|nr:Transcription factor [Macleaya cordata]
MEKKTQGRKKIAMEKITRKDRREITFSKRKTGLFKKASELSTLCGAETAIVVFSPANKPFSFGHPSVDSVSDQFLASNSPSEVGESSTIEPSFGDYYRSANINEFNRQVTEAMIQLEEEEEQGKKLTEIEKVEFRDRFLWNSPLEDLQYHELEQLKVSMEELKTKVYKEGEERQNGVPPPLSFMAVNPPAMVNPLRSQTNQNNNHTILNGFNYGLDHSYY